MRAPGTPPVVTAEAAPVDATAPVDAAPAIALADAPRIDLIANRARWHEHDGGLVVPIATEGLRKYAIEYRSPWGAVEDGGRVLRGRRATLTIPWEPAGDARVVVEARGTGTLAVRAGKARLGKARLGGAWEEVGFDVAAGTIAPGEVALTLEAPRGTRFRRVRIADGSTRCARSVLVEVPPDAYLVTRARGDGRVVVTAADGTRAEDPSSLAAFAGQLVRVDLEGCDVTWEEAAIAVAARPAPAPFTPARNVVLLVVDTLRADRIAALRDTRVETPRLTGAVRERGVGFRHHQAMAPSSPPSHATIHTGQIPRVHGATGDTGDVVAGAPVLAAILGDAGFRTIYVGNNDFAMGRLRKVAGWDVSRTMVYEGKGIDCAPMVEATLDEIREARAAGERYFVTMLPIEPHVPYRYHEGITEKYYPGPFGKPFGKRATSAHLGRLKKMKTTAQTWAHLRGLYDGEVERFDACYGALEDGLAALGADEDTAIVLTSDHGEGLGERGGRVGHAYGLHGELIDVPLLVIGAGLPARVHDVVTSNADVAPTILSLLGLPPDPRMQGLDLVPTARDAGPAPGRIVASEYGRSYALRGNRWRLVVGYDGKATLHDVVADPEEARDVSAEAPMARRWLLDAAGLYLAHRVAWRAATWGSLGDLAPTSPLALQ